MPSASPLHSQATALRGQIGGSWEIPHRSPRWAGVFSAVLPGAGQFYSGRARDGASALVVNGLLGALNWQLIQRELWVGVGFMGFVQLSFYGGNILAAANSAHKFNAAAWNTKLAMLTLYEPVLESRGARWSMVMAVP